MANTDTAAGKIRRALEERERPFTWLARQAHLPYKQVLKEIKHETRPLTLDTVLAVAPVLGTDLPTIASHEPPGGTRIASLAQAE